MQTLHNIRTGITEAWVWYWVMGGNGRRIGNTTHLYHIERSTPPPIPNIDPDTYAFRRQADYRRYWNVWPHPQNLSRNDILTPLCGRLDSRSQLPYLGTAQTPMWGGTLATCANCRSRALALGITPQEHREVVAADPWHQLNNNWEQYPNGWWLEPDPVTGQ